MIDAEDRLRRAFADAAATVREDQLRHDVPVRPRRRAASRRRGRLVIPAAAAAAVLAVAVAAVTIPAALRAGPHRPSTPASTGATAYVVASPVGNQGSSGEVVRISLASGRVIEPAIRLPAREWSAEITPDGKIICVLSEDLRHAYLTRINAPTGAAAPPIVMPAYSDMPMSVAITPAGRSAYVLAPEGLRTAGGVVPVNLVTGSVGRQISIVGAQQMVMSPDGRTAYVLSQPAGRHGTGRPQVVPIDTATNTALAPIKIPAGGLRVAAGGLADSIAVSPDGKTVYVATDWVNHLSTVTPISTASSAAMTPIPVRLAGYSGGMLAIAPDGDTAYLYGNSRYVVPLDLRTNKVLKPIRLPSGFACAVRKNACTAAWAWAFQIAPDSRTAYLYGPPDLDVIPVDLATGIASAPLVVGRPPYTQIAWSSGQGIAFNSGYLYAEVGYFTSPLHDPQFHGAFSEVQLATGKIKTIKLSSYWPQDLIVAP
jgi:hypothetical protein